MYTESRGYERLNMPDKKKKERKRGKMMSFIATEKVQNKGPIQFYKNLAHKNLSCMEI